MSIKVYTGIILLLILSLLIILWMDYDRWTEGVVLIIGGLITLIYNRFRMR